MRLTDKRATTNGRKSNRQLPISATVPTNASAPNSGGGLGFNFATADLIYTGNRVHNGSGYDTTVTGGNDWSLQVGGEYEVSNGNSDILITSGFDNVYGVQAAQFRQYLDENNWAKVYLADAGGGSFLPGMSRIKDGSSDAEIDQHVSLNINSVSARHGESLGAVESGDTSLSLSADKAQLINSYVNPGGISSTLSLDIERDVFRFYNDTDTGYTFPNVQPAREYEALVDDGTTTGTTEWRPTVPSFVASTPTKLPGQYLGRNHYRDTVVLGGGTDGSVAYTLPAGAFAAFPPL